uniref:BTB domain-containing protein n=1 Tax=Meloidogyne incognita TaxID=6306 RepID=A0A914N3L2_MELIC
MDEKNSLSSTQTTNNYFKKFLSNLNELRNNCLLCDVEIECQEKVIYAHRVILAASIEYFRGLFNSGMADAVEKRIVLKEITFIGLKQIVDFAYTYESYIDENNVRQSLQAANYLGINSVKEACETFLTSRINVGNCIELYELADQYNCLKLFDSIYIFILEHFLEFSKLPQFLSLNSITLLERLTSSDELFIPDEYFLFEFLINWIKQNEEERLIYLPKLLKNIRFFQIPTNKFLNNVLPNTLINKCPEALTFVRSQTEAILGKIVGNNSFGNIDGVTNSSTLVSFRPRKVYAGVIFCVGGRGSRLDPFKSVEVFDWLHNCWHQICELKIGRRHVGVICVGSRIYAIGGHDGTEHLSSVECLDVKEESWRDVAPMNVRRRGMAVGALGDAIYAVGGLDDQNCYRAVERYDIQENLWVQVADMTTPRGGVAVAAYDGKLYAIGGNSGTHSLETCEKYDPILNKWTSIAPMKNRRAGSGVAIIGPYLYVIGGFDDDSPLSTCERYSFAENVWKEIEPLSCARGGVGVTAMGGRIFAIGGHDSHNYLNTVEAYDPLSEENENKWTEIASISQRRAGAGVAWSPCSIKEISFSDENCDL